MSDSETESPPPGTETLVGREARLARRAQRAADKAAAETAAREAEAREAEARAAEARAADANAANEAETAAEPPASERHADEPQRSAPHSGAQEPPIASTSNGADQAAPMAAPSAAQSGGENFAATNQSANGSSGADSSAAALPTMMLHVMEKFNQLMVSNEECMRRMSESSDAREARVYELTQQMQEMLSQAQRPAPEAAQRVPATTATPRVTQRAAVTPAQQAAATTAPQMAPLMVQTAGASSGYISATHSSSGRSVQGDGASVQTTASTSAPGATNWTDAKEKLLNSRLKEMRTYHGEEKEDLDAFIEDFQELKDDMHLSEFELAMHIKNKIKGDAKNCYKGLSSAEKKSPEKIFSTFRQRFGEILTLEKCNKDLSANMQKQHQSVRQYYNAMERLKLRREKFVIENLGEEKLNQYKEMWNSEIVGHFRKGLKPDLAERIVGKQFGSLQEIFDHLRGIELDLSDLKQDSAQWKTRAGLISEATVMHVQEDSASALAAQIEEASPEPKKKKVTCYKCQSTEHWTSRCPEKKKSERSNKCFSCNEEGHMRSACPKKKTRCFLCGDPSHLKPNCPNVFCQKCMKPGHWTHECLFNKADQTAPKNA